MALDATPQMGPQAHKEKLAETLRFKDIGSGEGARLVAGGKWSTENGLEGGHFVAPAVSSTAIAICAPHVRKVLGQ
jgi:acyl-CoA reductase-like NAD-dependent aldehyde dehydrogenase